MITMTFNEALRIQRSQMSYYRQMIGRRGVKAIKAKTYYPSDINPNEQMSVVQINRLVPRGGNFERLYTNNWRNFEHCKDNLAWSKAIKKGFV